MPKARASESYPGGQRVRGPVIAVSGLPGAGKSTLAKALAKELELRYLSTGSLFRSLSKSRGVGLVEAHFLAERDTSLDLEVDSRAYEAALEGGVVVDGHLSGWLLSRVADLKIFLTAPLEVRAARVAERDGLSLKEAMEQLVKREESNRKRYLKLYGIDISDLSCFDIVLNTAKWSKEELASLLVALARAALNLKP
ncbi:MAG: AAA family ATPase [Candidatus Nezhaarchaeota archaeon]|nr:AAA family ATPase [Candidatus Nezhaarchaeota archaeon]